MAMSGISTNTPSGATALSTDPSKDSTLESLHALAAAVPQPPPLTQGAETSAPARRKCSFTVASFAHKSRALDADGYSKIDEVIRRLDGYSIYGVVVEGHIDSSEVPTHQDDDGEGEEADDMLGLERAATARRYLISKYRLRPDHVQIEDLADSAPALSDDGATQAAANRRVEITLKLRQRSAPPVDDDRDDDDGVVLCYFQSRGGRAECV